MHLLRTRVAALLACLASACAHPTPRPQDSAMPAPPESRYPGLHMQDEVPDMSPAEMGRRFLQLIDSLQRYDQLTLDHVQQVMRLKLEGQRGRPGPQFNVRMPESGWHYAIGFSESDDEPNHTRAELDFLHRDDAGLVDMAAVCALDFEAYHQALLAMGFVERTDLVTYELQHWIPFTNAQGETEHRLMPPQPVPLPYADYSRGDVGVSIRYRPEVAHIESDRRRPCVRRIAVGMAAAPRP
ncbi:hypothetical protein CMZ82_13290 [Lysobacteraceae bacterium NML93-0792]|nr:hypothetical protein CMZ82_13290 [Xanthomonadaceae bacterium NML93-0792]PBS14826.1 hypothetical protein CMZ81_14135 [Xanthomonadaceae bacterium NML93-0793]PBS18751.1 hypothetical protein CMZ80_10795 [Xanthomonadaceae bacterium NML93-0831]